MQATATAATSVAAPGVHSRPRTGLVVAACVGLAVVSLVVRSTLAFDAWAWLVWGREIGDLSLDTTGGPSWKPLPVLVTTLFAPTGNLAPLLWLVVVRATTLLALVGAFRLGSRLAGRWAGILAAALLAVLPFGGARLPRLVLEGHADMIGIAAAVWVLECHLAGARARALVLLTTLALIRPEAWPFLAVYAAWLWRRDPARRLLTVAVVAAVPVLWFGGDWLGSGDPWNGAGAAQVASAPGAERLGEALERALGIVGWPIWAAAAAGVALAVRERARPAVALAVAAVAWIGLVVGMAALLRYAALIRFFAPAIALICVVAAVGVVRALALARPGPARWIVSFALLVASLPGLVPRLAELGDVVEQARGRHRLEQQLDAAIADAGGADAIVSCGAVAIDARGLAETLRPGLAWKLDVPLSAIRRGLGSDPGVRFWPAGAADAAGRVLGRSDAWVVRAVDCPPSSGD